MTYLEILVIALPAFAANIAPVVAARLGVWKSLAVPIDGNRMWAGSAILGSHKTWRGVVAAACAGASTAGILYLLHVQWSLPLFVHESLVLACIYGALAGCVCMGGDAIKSLVKRRVGIESGRPFIPFDQIDYIVAFIVGTWTLFDWNFRAVFFLLAVAFCANLCTNALAYALRIKSTYW